jgi:hypothetical protein
MAGQASSWRRAANPRAAAAAVVALVADVVVAHGAADVLVLALPVSFLTVGWLVVRRYPDNVEGRLLLGVGLAWAVTINLQLAGAWVVPVGLMGTHLLLRYPDGRLPSVRWAWFATTCTALLVLVPVLVTTASESTPNGHRNPLYVPWTQALVFLPAILLVAMLGSVASIVVRYRRADDRTRAQIRWLAVAAVAIVAIYCVAIAASFTYDAAHQVDTLHSNWFDAHYPLWLLGLQLSALLSFLLVPAAFGVAILRYRLYEIDRLISRTTAYACVTGVLVLVFTGIVVGAGRLLGATSDTVVAVATLVTAAIARPLLRRVQSAVDRRFNRARYDAEGIVEAFGSRLRDEVETTQVAHRLEHVVADALQPAHLGLWVRQR